MNEPPERPIDVPLPNSIVTANRIPFEFFRSTGSGQSPHQIHAGSYHDAMRNAGVELGNIVPYTSILPPIAKEISRDEGISRITHGTELMAIHAVAHVDRDLGQDHATAAILYGWLIPKGKRNVKPAGGLVCEYNGSGTLDQARENLKACLQDLYRKPNHIGYCFSDDFKLQEEKPLGVLVKPTVRFGTAYAILPFVSFVTPVKAHNLNLLELEALVNTR